MNETKRPPDEEPSSVRVSTFQERVKRFMDALSGVMDDYERTEPLWEIHTLLDLAEGAVHSFRHHLTQPDSQDGEIVVEALSGVEVLSEEEFPPPVTDEETWDMGLSSEDVARHAEEPIQDSNAQRTIDAVETGPSWAAPEVELQYAVEWDWKNDRMVSGVLKDTELEESPAQWGEPGARLFVTHRNLFVLRRVTRQAIIRHRDGISLQAIPLDLLKRFPSLENLLTSATSQWELSMPRPDIEEAGRRALDARYRPFVLSPDTLPGVAEEFFLQSWDALFKSDTPPARLPEGVTPREFWRGYVPPERKDEAVYMALDGSLEQPDLPPLLTLRGHRNDKAFDAALHVVFHPLVVDDDERRAYFPVVVSLTFEGEADRPDTWTDEDRAKLWEAFLEAISEIREAVDRVVPPTIIPEQRLHVPWARSKDRRGPRPETTEPAPPPQAEQPTVPPPERVGPPPLERRKTFPLPFGPTLADADALAVARTLHRVRFPARRMPPSWSDLEAREVASVLDEEGERAFKDLPGGRPALLKKVTRKGQDLVVLTEEGERRLKIRHGLGSNGFRYVDPHNGREYLTRLFAWRGGFLEVGLSWFRLAGPWVEDWRKEKQREATETPQASLFDLLDPEQQAEVERRVLRARLLDDSHRLMECVLGAVGKYRQSAVAIPAEAFRVLLGLQNDPHWRGRLEGGLSALRECEFRIRSFETTTMKGYGSFLAAWQYRGAGPGAHGDGVYSLYVTPPFLGCLNVFETARRRLDAGLNVSTFDFSKRLTEDQMATLGWGYDRKAKTRRRPVSTFVEFDAGRVFYDAQEGLTPSQSALHAFVDEQITRRKDAVGRTFGHYQTRKAEQLPASHRDATYPRLYDSTLCPLLPEGRRYCAALGNFGRGFGETGWKLYGTPRRESATGGAHKAGLLDRMGYTLPAGGATRARAKIVEKALEDLKAVVVDYLKGVVAAYHAGRWLSLDEAAKLPDDDLGRRTRWFLFVPDTYKADRRAKWEAETGYAVTEDPAEAARAARGDLGPELPLRLRLRMARVDRKLSQAGVGSLFGVNQQTVAFWELGTEPDEAGRVKGKPIPGELIPLVERWVRDGTPPSPEDLAARKTARTGLKKPVESTTSR